MPCYVLMLPLVAPQDIDSVDNGRHVIFISEFSDFLDPDGGNEGSCCLSSSKILERAESSKCIGSFDSRKLMMIPSSE